ncbi:PREDICTED: inner centromere protein-like [Vollenhovia emeryi]|uniref:inner centromere protein-like n=1 Tax=Vollenhovia emeryi TaxID=411798 RepID=UPI0005F4DF27|nr:PREDICTED: inner centromere protein-like [Vollenhovia emeryi]
MKKWMEEKEEMKKHIERLEKKMEEMQARKQGTNENGGEANEEVKRLEGKMREWSKRGRTRNQDDRGWKGRRSKVSGGKDRRFGGEEEIDERKKKARRKRSENRRRFNVEAEKDEMENGRSSKKRKRKWQKSVAEIWTDSDRGEVVEVG